MRRESRPGGAVVGWMFKWDSKAFMAILCLSVVSFTLLNIAVRAMESKTNLDFVDDDFHGSGNSDIKELATVDTFNYTGHKVTILMWDGGTPFGWGDGQVINPPNYGGFRYDKEVCPVECSFTTDRARLPSVESVLFDVCLTGPDGYRDIPVYMPDKLIGQQWGWFTYEQWYYFPMMQEKEFMNRFDYKMTYHHNAEVQITFACPWGGHADLLKPPSKKTKLVAFFASNCNTGGADERNKYVEELMKYIKVDSYGACLHNTDHQWGRSHSNGDNMKEKIEVISEYKFLLAFENNNKVDDYVTEKLINAFQAGTVPVYWGAPNVDMWAIAPHSIVKATDYANPRALAEYLNHLNENEEEYNEYLSWKKTGISESFKRLWANCLFFAECRLCKHIAKERSKIANLKLPTDLPREGIIGYALRINGLDTDLYNDDDYVEVRHHPSLDLTYYTLMAWIKLEMILDGRIIDKNQAGDIMGYELDIIKSKSSPGKGHLRLCAGGGCFYSTRTLGLGIWYHVAATFDEKNIIKLYINGKVDSSHTASHATAHNNLPIRFGRASRGGGSWRPHHAATVFDGTIDEISIWGRVFEESEIYKYMFLRPIGDEEALVAWWNFNEGKGSEVHDIGPHQNHGHIAGHPTWVVSVSKPVLDPSNLEVTHATP